MDSVFLETPRMSALEVGVEFRYDILASSGARSFLAAAVQVKRKEV